MKEIKGGGGKGGEEEWGENGRAKEQLEGVLKYAGER